MDLARADGLRHCTGTYGSRCLDGEVHVASVRIPTGSGFRRLSTLSLSPVQGHPNVAIDQHLGLANGDPPDDAKLAVDELMALFEDRPPALPTPIDAKGRGAILVLRNTRDTDRLIAWWTPYLPRRLREGGPEAIRARILALAHGFDPRP